MSINLSPCKKRKRKLLILWVVMSQNTGRIRSHEGQGKKSEQGRLTYGKTVIQKTVLPGF